MLSLSQRQTIQNLGARGNGIPFSFQDEWSYRRLLANGNGAFNNGDLSVSNWIPGKLFLIR